MRPNPRHVNPRYTAFARPRPPPSPAAISPASHRFRQPSSPISVSPVQNPRLSHLPGLSRFRIRHSLAPSEPSEKSVVKPSAPTRPHPCLRGEIPILFSRVSQISVTSATSCSKPPPFASSRHFSVQNPAFPCPIRAIREIRGKTVCPHPPSSVPPERGQFVVLVYFQAGVGRYLYL